MKYVYGLKKKQTMNLLEYRWKINRYGEQVNERQTQTGDGDSERKKKKI